MQNEQYSVSPTIQFEDAKIVKYTIEEMETDVTRARSEGYLAALSDMERDLEYLKKSSAFQETSALKRGVASLQEYWNGRLKELDKVRKIIDNLRASRIQIMLFHKDGK